MTVKNFSSMCHQCQFTIIIILIIGQWFNTCIVDSTENFQTSAGLGVYLVQIRGFSFNHTNNFLIVNIVFPIPPLIVGCLVNFSKLSYGGEFLWTMTEI